MKRVLGFIVALLSGLGILYLAIPIWIGLSYILTLNFSGFSFTPFELQLNPIYFGIGVVIFIALIFVFRSALRVANGKGRQ